MPQCHHRNLLKQLPNNDKKEYNIMESAQKSIQTLLATNDIKTDTEGGGKLNTSTENTLQKHPKLTTFIKCVKKCLMR